MRKFIFIYLFIAVFSSTLCAQNEMLPDGRKWIIREYRHPDFGNLNKTIEFYIKGDTLINNISYKKIYDAFVPQFVRWDGTKCFSYLPNQSRDILIFDESWNMGDTTIWCYYDTRITIKDTGILQDRKFWTLDFGYGTWLKGLGYKDEIPFCYERAAGSALFDLICCVEANGDTLYVNRDLMYMLETSIENISFDVVSYKIFDGKLVTILPTDVSSWSATLYNSNGIKVAQDSGNGNEIILPITSKGTHILVIKADDKVIKKKIFIK